jgi:hypothetical protein
MPKPNIREAVCSQKTYGAARSEFMQIFGVVTGGEEAYGMKN